MNKRLYEFTIQRIRNGKHKRFNLYLKNRLKRGTFRGFENIIIKHFTNQKEWYD